VGDVLADGSRAVGTRIVRNSALITHGTCVTTVTPGRATLPGRGSTWLWPASAVLTGASSDGSALVAVFTQRMRHNGVGAWGFARTGSAVVTLAVHAGGAAKVIRVRDLPATEILWGAGTATAGDYTYVYGTRSVDEPWVFGRDLMLARAPTNTVGDSRTWTYRTADGWSSDPEDAVAVVPARVGVSTTTTVVVRGTEFLIVTKPQEFLDDRVVVMSSSAPYGPWAMRTLFRSASSATRPTYSPTVVASDGLGPDVVVVSRTSTNAVDLMAHAQLTVPLFRDVDLTR
jgi:hypothetical protein